MERQKYKFLQNYKGYKNGKNVSDCDLKWILCFDNELYKNYARKSGQGNGECENYGCGIIWRPNCDKIFGSFLEDLLNLGVIRRVIPSRKK
jgi:hypothetical protein